VRLPEKHTAVSYVLETGPVLAYSASNRKPMSEFVNYNKRSIQLPPGCKDLTDLFKPAWLRKLPKGDAPPEMPVVLRDDSVTETLGNIEKYVAIVFESRADGCHLTISSPGETDETLALCISNMTDSIMSNVTFIHDETREEAMRAFFDSHGLKAPRANEMPKGFNFAFYPNLPVWTIFEFSPLSSGALAFSKIARDLFRDFCGMNDQSELQFSLLEFDKAK